MLLYLVQHGEAKREEEDPSRGLTDKGFRDAALAALYAREHGVTVSRIVHSSKKRAMQTAKVFADHLKPKEGTEEVDGIGPMDDPAVWAERIRGMHEDAMLVGHLPHLAKLAGLLLAGDSNKTFIDFKNSGIVCLKRSDDDMWALEWMVVPEMMG